MSNIAQVIQLIFVDRWDFITHIYTFRISGRGLISELFGLPSCTMWLSSVGERRYPLRIRPGGSNAPEEENINEPIRLRRVLYNTHILQILYIRIMTSDGLIISNSLISHSFVHFTFLHYRHQYIAFHLSSIYHKIYRGVSYYLVTPFLELEHLQVIWTRNRTPE